MTPSPRPDCRACNSMLPFTSSGLVRIDAGFVGRRGLENANPRRTGRFTTPDMLGNFTPAVQVFNGTADYQIYMVLPFRLPSWRPGYYMCNKLSESSSLSLSVSLFLSLCLCLRLSSARFRQRYCALRCPGSALGPVGGLC